MRSVTFLGGLIILGIAFVLEFWLGSAGIHVVLVLATLIGFAFLFDLAELIFFVLFAVFIINWQPTVSTGIIVFMVIPIVAYIFRKSVPWQGWLGNLIAIFLGFFLLYLFLSPTFILLNPGAFFLDLVISLAFGEAVFFLLNQS